VNRAPEVQENNESLGRCTLKIDVGIFSTLCTGCFISPYTLFLQRFVIAARIVSHGLSGCALLCFSFSVTISSAMDVDLTLRSRWRRPMPPPSSPTRLDAASMTLMRLRPGDKLPAVLLSRYRSASKLKGHSGAGGLAGWLAAVAEAAVGGVT
jgi:hypothetical protein